MKEESLTLHQLQNPDGAEALLIDSRAWQYDKQHDVFWQLGVAYCAAPTAAEYHSLGIFVPGAYMKMLDDGTAAVDLSGKLAGFTAETAPFAMPVDTPGYWAMSAPNEYDYDSIAKFIEAGMIYLHAGCRGRESGVNPDQSAFCGGAPWGVADLKSAVRWLRYNSHLLPGDCRRVFTFGHSGGGAQSSLMGASGDSDLFAPYLAINGALMRTIDGEYISDAVMGSMCWCPVTTLGAGGAAYEWMMGQHFDLDSRSGEKWTSALSKKLAEAYAKYVNASGFTDENGEILTLEPSDEGFFCSGSYYDRVKAEIERSLQEYLSDHPMTESERADYFASLNDKESWVAYDALSGRVSVDSVAGFVRRCKLPFKRVGAFDDVEYQQIENVLFGTPENRCLHFDAVMGGCASDKNGEYSTFDDFDSNLALNVERDLAVTDCAGNTVAQRVYMYDPLSYIHPSPGRPDVRHARFWRINSGIEQGDTSLTTELNLALALRRCPSVERVDFTTVWQVGHTFAERRGDCIDNLVGWIKECVC